MNTYFALFIIAFVFSFILTPIIRNTAIKLGWVDQPDERRVHTSPIPRIGGVAIFGAFLLSVTVVLLLHSAVAHKVKEEIVGTLYLIGPCCLVFLVGVYDDLYGVNAKVKIAAQAIAGILLYVAGYRIEAISFPMTGTLTFHYLSLPITVLWVVGISNAFNLIDGLDGLSAGASIFATLTVAMIALINGRPIIAFMSFALAGSIVGFLKYNFNPATIFMGDSGALFIGSMLAALSIHGAQKGSTVVAIAIPVVSFGLPILETFLSMTRRFLGGKPVFTADREHIHHVLLRRGLSMRQAVIVLYAVSAVFSMFGLLFLNPDNRFLGLTLFVLGLCVWIGIQHLGYHEIGEMGRLVNRGVGQRQIIVNNIKIRRAGASLADATTLAEIDSAMKGFMETGEFDHAEIRFKGFESADPAKVQGFMKWGNVATEPAAASGEIYRHWTLKLPLYFDDDTHMGELTLYRSFRRPEMMIDINLVHTCLYPELRKSLSRAITNRAARGVGSV